MGIFDRDSGADPGDGEGEVVDATERIAERIAESAGDLPELPAEPVPAADAGHDSDSVEVLIVTAHNGLAKGTRLLVTRDRAEALVASQLAVRVVEGG